MGVDALLCFGVEDIKSGSYPLRALVRYRPVGRWMWEEKRGVKGVKEAKTKSTRYLHVWRRADDPYIIGDCLLVKTPTPVEYSTIAICGW